MNFFSQTNQNLRKRNWKKKTKLSSLQLFICLNKETVQVVRCISANFVCTAFHVRAFYHIIYNSQTHTKSTLRTWKIKNYLLSNCSADFSVASLLYFGGVQNWKEFTVNNFSQSRIYIYFSCYNHNNAKVKLIIWKVNKPFKFYCFFLKSSCIPFHWILEENKKVSKTNLNYFSINSV